MTAISEAVSQATATFGGQLLTLADAGYDEARRVHNGLVDAHPVDDPHGAGQGIKVPTLSFADAIAQARAAGHGPVRFVKLDCEGGEYQMAYRSQPADWAEVERVVLEYHDVPGESWSELRAWFAAAGLHLVAHRPERADLGLAWLARGPVPVFPG